MKFLELLRSEPLWHSRVRTLRCRVSLPVVATGPALVRCAEANNVELTQAGSRLHRVAANAALTQYTHFAQAVRL